MSTFETGEEWWLPEEARANTMPRIVNEKFFRPRAKSDSRGKVSSEDDDPQADEVSGKIKDLFLKIIDCDKNLHKPQKHHKMADRLIIGQV